VITCLQISQIRSSSRRITWDDRSRMTCKDDDRHRAAARKNTDSPSERGGGENLLERGSVRSLIKGPVDYSERGRSALILAYLHCANLFPWTIGECCANCSVTVRRLMRRE